MKRHRTFTHIAFANSLDSVYTVFFKSQLILSLVILTAPVIQGCHKHEHPQDSGFTEVQQMSSVKLAVRQMEDTQIRTIDAFVFNDDPLQRIDCYQRFDDFNGEYVSVGACSGRKLMLLCANAPWDAKGWEDVSSYCKATSIKVNLEDENRAYPVMSATVHADAGENAEIILERLSSEIELRSLRCDFSGKPYQGECITDARAYLININGTCSIAPTTDETIERIINHGSLIPDDIIKFDTSQPVSADIGTITSVFTSPEIRLLCYPNTAEHESLGTPFTRLVIEGKIQGETWYWPININRGCGSDHEGIERNNKYVYDITIKGKGTKDPDTPIVPKMVETIFEISRWKEKEPYHVAF